MKLLIVEDEKELARAIIDYLNQDNFLCETANTFDEAIEKLSLYDYECAVVDVMLPDGSGLEIVKYLKENHSDLGIIIASAKNALDDKIKGLEYGADDYITKPFHLSELSARIKSIIRRRKFNGETTITLEEIKIFPDKHEVFVKQNKLDLTSKEYDLLMYFISNKNRVLTKEAIAENLIGDHADMMDSFSFIYTHIKNLRKKIVNAGGGDRISSIYSIGYKFLA